MLVLDTTVEQIGPDPEGMQERWKGQSVASQRAYAIAESLVGTGIPFMLLIECDKCAGRHTPAVGTSSSGPIHRAHFVACKFCSAPIKSRDGDPEALRKYVRDNFKR
jgi:hypothetical protein